MEGTVSSNGTQQPKLPPGFRFHPTDEELVVHYLKRKANSAPLPVAIIADVDLYKFDPWELPAKATFGEHEWYFFSPRDRKYPNGARPNRAATSGYWKATGTDKPVLTAGGTQKIGVKKALVFYGGKPPKGTKTDWIMHEYRLAENKVTNKPPGYNIDNKNNSLRLDDWVLCRIYKKNNTSRPSDHEKDDSLDDILGHVPPPFEFRSPNLRFPFNGMLDNDHTTMLQGMLSNEGSISQLALASSKTVFPMAATNISTTNILPLTRTFHSLCWNEEDVACQSPTKRFHADVNNGNCTTMGGNNGPSSIANMLSSQLPPGLSLHQPAMMGSLEYQMPGMNWFS